MTFDWAALQAAEPEFMRTVQDRFQQFTHHTLATLRKDGSPRTSGTEVSFRFGELWLGSMPGAMKARDLIRDPRFALQANQGEGQGMGGGDVRVAGRAIEVSEDDDLFARFRDEVKPPPGPFHLFRTELTEIVRTYVEGDGLLITLWKPDMELRTIRRQ